MWWNRTKPSSGTQASCPWCGAHDAIRLGTIVHSFADGRSERCVPVGSLLHCIRPACGCDYKSLAQGVVVISSKPDEQPQQKRKPNEPVNVTPVMRNSRA